MGIGIYKYLSFIGKLLVDIVLNCVTCCKEKTTSTSAHNLECVIDTNGIGLGQSLECFGSRLACEQTNAGGLIDVKQGSVRNVFLFVLGFAISCYAQ